LHALPDRQASPARRRPARGAARQPEAFPSRDVSQDATLHEVLLADDLRLGGTLAAAFPDGARAKFEAVFPTDDLLRTLTRARHRFDVEARLEITPAAGGQAAVYDCAYGRCDLLPAHAASRGPLPLLLVVLQLLMLLPVLGLLLAGAGALLQGDLALGLGRLGAALAVSLSAALLPFWRAVLTWLQLRGLRDIRENVRSDWSAGQLARWVLLLVKQMVHAGEVRTMRYRVPLCLADADRWPQLPRKLLLTAHKRVAYAATIAELTAFVLRRRRRSLDGGQEHVPIRSTFWDQVMDAQVRITADGRAGRLRTLARGVFRMGFETLVAAGAGTGPGGPIRLGMRGDTTNGLLAAAAYPLLFLRFGLKTRMFDFRLPNYSGAPVPDVADKVDAGLRVAGSEQLLGPELHWVDVPRGRSSGDTGDEPGAPLRLPVRRYRPRDAMGKPRRAEVAEGSWEGIPVARAKAVLLLHAFGQSGLTYTFKTTDQNLAECFLAEGYEVWVLEMRMSTRSGYGTDPSTVDQIALHDIPHTVRHMLAQIRAESPTERPLQVAAFAHCIGSAALWMSLLAGRLSHRTPADPKAAPEDVPRLSMLSHAMFSQLHPCVVGGRVPQAKTWLPALLQKVWRHGSVPFAVRGEQGGILLPLLDRLLASLPAPALEQRRPFGNDDAAATCRRIRYIDAQLFRHEHIGDATLGIMNRLFGEANLRLFGQARRFIERGHLVDEDGGSRYVTDRNIRSNLAFPIQLMHGEENELFDIAGAEATFARLGQHHLGWQAQFCTRAPQGKPAFVRVPRYGHLDVLIGDRAHLDVYPDVMAFFRLAYGTAQQAAGLQPATGWRPHLPQNGPFVGWTRRQGADLLVRVSFVPESGAGCEHDPGRIRLRRWTGGHFETWTAVRWHVHPGPYHVMWGDIRLPADAPVADRWQVLTLAPAWGPAAVPLDADDAALDGGLAALTALELAGAEFQLPDATVAKLAPRSAVTFGAATCRYPGLGLDAGRIDAAVRDFLTDTRGDQAAFTTLLGDQIYADYTAGLVDPLSPLERYYERHALAFRRGALGDLLAAMPVYMTPDDHEWTDNYPSASPLVKEPWPDWSDPNVPFGQTEQRAFRFASGAVRAFQRLQSPLGPAPGPHAWFQHGCTRFFMMDSRSQRQRNHPAIVASMARLARWLAAPQARGALNVIACGSVVLPGLRSDADPADGGASDTWQYAEAQRRELLELLVDLVPGRFLLLSGDYHVSGAVRVKVDDQVVGAAIVAPPLYAPQLYANSTPEAVFVQERIPLSAGRTLHMDVPPGGAMERGSGIGLVSVQPQGEGFAVGFQRQLWVWERGSRRSHDCRIGLGVPQGPCTPLAQAEESGVAQP
ncbi:MAG: alkaline phosphatase D family protein, partial [Ramlibacter sp.]